MNIRNSHPVKNQPAKPSPARKSNSNTSLPRQIQILCALVALSFLCFPLVAEATTTINHQFTSATINPGDTSQYQITIANTSLVPLTAAAVTEVLLSQVQIASPANIFNTCGFTVNAATPGTSTVYLTGGTIPAGTGTVDGQCYFQLNVTSTAAGNWVNAIPANTTPNAATSGYTAKENGVDVFNTTPANATLSVNTLIVPTGSKVFAPSPAIAGDPVTLTITLNNPNAGATLPLTTFTDTLPTGMVVAPTPSASTTCSGGSVAATAGSGTITLTGGTIAISGSCTVTAKVLVSSIGTNTTQSFTNSLAAGAIGNTRGLTSTGFSQALTVNTPPVVAKSFATSPIAAGQQSRMTITITNRSTTNALDITSFSDNLTGTSLKILNTASTPVAATANPSVSCTGTGAVNGTLSAPADLINQTITLTGAKAGPSGVCTVTAYLTSTVDGAHTNTIAANAVANPNNYASASVNASLTTYAQLTVAKSVALANVAPGQWTRFTVAISNWSTGTVSNVFFKDVLPAAGGNQMTLFDAGSGFYTTDAGCTGGTWTGTTAAGTSTGNAPTATDYGLQWSGGTIVAGSGASAGVCTISLWAKLPASAATGTVFTNNIPINSITGEYPPGTPITNNQSGSSVNVTTVDSVAITKPFSPNSIAQGAQSTLTITIFNRTVSALTGVNLTDNLPAGVRLAANPAATNTCGGTLQASPNDTKVILSGGATVAGRPAASQDSNCAITVRVVGTTTGVFTNTLRPADFSNTQGTTIPANVNQNLTVTTGLTGAKSFTPTSVASGGKARVKITVTNANAGNGRLTNVSVDDNTFSAGLVVANPANGATSCAGSPTLVVNPGATRAQLLGATLNGGASCDFSFDVVASGAGPWSNTIPIGKITSAEGEANTAAVTANLTAATAQININKSFNPVLVTGGQPSILTIDVINPSTTAMSGIGFTDTFPLGIEVYSVPNASTTCTGGTVTAIPGDGKVILSGAALAASSTCRVLVTTTSVKFLNLTNTIPASSIVSNAGFTNPSGTSATLSTLQGLNVMKAFSPAYVAPSQVTTLRMRLREPFDPNAPIPMTLTGVSYTDTLPGGVLIAATPNATTDCAGTGTGGLAEITTSNNGTTNGLVTVSRATIQPGTHCFISVDVVASALGAYNNTIPQNTVNSDQGVVNNSDANATLYVVNKPTVSKLFTNTTRTPGQATTLTVTVTNSAPCQLPGWP